MSRSEESYATRGLCRGEGSLQLFGDETGLPLIQCPDCKKERVVERRSRKDNSNLLRVYFKCPDCTGLPGCCPFYRWQKQYLRHLVENRVLIGEQWQGAEEHGNDEVGESGALEAGSNAEKVLAAKLDDMVRAMKMTVKMLVVVVACVLVAAVAYVFK